MNSKLTDDYIKGYHEGFVNGIDAKYNYKVTIFGMDAGEVLDILSNHVKNKQKSEVPHIPIGFSFDWNKRKEINDFFEMINRQGFKVTKE